MVGLAAVAGLTAALAAPMTATAAPRVTHESYTMTGVIADAYWFSEDEPAVGTPQVVYVMGADAMSTHRVPGQKPQHEPQPPVIAMGLTMPGVEPGDEPYPAELWCVPEDYTFTVARDLSRAQLEVPTCEAQVVVYNEETGEEEANGVVVTIGVTATWTATAPAETSRSHSRYSFGSSWTMDINQATIRRASADITVTGLPGGSFQASVSEAQIQQVRSATLMHQ